MVQEAVLTEEEFRAVMGENLKSARTNRGLTPAELADLSGVGRTTLGVYERGERTASSYALFRLARAMGMSPLDLLP